jgi:uncharacterized membrane protein
LNNYKDVKHNQELWPWWRLSLLVLNIIGLFLSIILSLHHLEVASMIGCSSGGSCDQVLTSPWSKIAGVIPISGLAVGVYSSMFITIFFIGNKTEIQIRRLAWSALLIMVGSITGSAVWFIIVQKWMIGSFCFYCMTTHIVGLILTAIIIWQASKNVEVHSKEISLNIAAIVLKVFHAAHKKNNRQSGVIGKFFIGLMLAGTMAILQAGPIPSGVYQDGNSETGVPKLDYKTVPMIGSPNAPYKAMLLFDYQCSHCQKIHSMLNEVVQRYHGKLAFVLCPTPLNTHCNPYIPRDVDAFKNSCELAKIGLAVWIANHDVFAAFENWMFAFDSGDSWQPRDLENVKAKATELVGKEKFELALNNPWIEQYLQICIRTFGQTLQNGNGGIPKITFGTRWIIPQPRNTDDLIMILRKSLGVPEQ